jgi:hypothetical protein
MDLGGSLAIIPFEMGPLDRAPGPKNGGIAVNQVYVYVNTSVGKNFHEKTVDRI